MRSVAVAFRLGFATASRRMLTPLDASSAGFLASLSTALVAVLPSGITDRHLHTELTDTPGEVRVTIIGLNTVPSVSINGIIERVDESSFLTQLGERMGASVTLPQAASVIVRSTPMPSPPPATPPSTPPPPPPASPPPPPSPFTPAFDQALTHDAQSQSLSTSQLSSEMLWVIILATITAAVCLGCTGAYYCGVRHTRALREQSKVVHVHGRPSSIDDEESTSPQDMATATSLAAAVSTAQQRQLIEIGMHFERQRSGQGSADFSTLPTTVYQPNIVRAASSLHTRSPMPPPVQASTSEGPLPSGDGVHAALAIINEVRSLAESLSPRAHAPTTVRIEPSRIENLPRSHSMPLSLPRSSNDADDDARI